MSAALKIRQLRLKKKKSLRELSLYLGVAVTTYRAWEMGRKIPSNALKKIAEYHHVTVGYLLGQENNDHEAIRRAIYYVEEGLELMKSTLN